MSEHLSNTQLKNRLLGAGILVVAAVVVIPLFLGDPKYVVEPELEPPDSTSFESKIQALPEALPVTADTVESNSGTPGENDGLVLKKLGNREEPASEKSGQFDIQPLRLDTLDTESEKIKTAVAAPTPKATPKPESVAKSTTPPKTRSSAPTSSKAKITSGWAVQAGIFSKAENATAIAETLKNSGYSPNVSDARASFGKAKRVWIGPFASKQEAQSISKRLEQQTGNGGYVAVYPFKS